MIVGLSKMYKEQQITKAPGDWQQIKWLSALYKRDLYVLNDFEVLAEFLPINERALAEIQLIKMRVRIKEIDAKIYMLMFGKRDIDIKGEPIKVALKAVKKRVYRKGPISKGKSTFSYRQLQKIEVGGESFHCVYKYNLEAAIKDYRDHVGWAHKFDFKKHREGKMNGYLVKRVK